jgi:hypothetical protein
MSRSKLIFSDNSSLSTHEKMVVHIFCCFLFVLIKFAFRAPEERWPQNIVKENFTKRQIVIWISGEIENEGKYHFNEGDTLKVALKAVSLKKEADLKGLDLSKPLKTGQRIKIKKLHKPLVNK